ncbi:unnamed protein product [Clonostachys rosea f. rosea IK726]|uniref:Uncharacterized protein n=1 Tax=Clonostachys rosea f. rosea IK726 TaxID=1349383 RepID=A0ACA9TEU9_BIOOC|nr:unnamed protein product [Clonostachys rosea f. rosea IK726]
MPFLHYIYSSRLSFLRHQQFSCDDVAISYIAVSSQYLPFADLLSKLPNIYQISHKEGRRIATLPNLRYGDGIDLNLIQVPSDNGDWTYVACDERPLDTVVIKADSEYLVKGMTEWVFKWETNGYKPANRKPVKNSKLFQELHALIKELNTSNVKVFFWQVPREMNKEADRLANEAF